MEQYALEQKKLFTSDGLSQMYDGYKNVFVQAREATLRELEMEEVAFNESIVEIIYGIGEGVFQNALKNGKTEFIGDDANRFIAMLNEQVNEFAKSPAISEAIGVLQGAVRNLDEGIDFTPEELFHAFDSWVYLFNNNTGKLTEALNPLLDKMEWSEKWATLDIAQEGVMGLSFPSADAFTYYLQTIDRVQEKQSALTTSTQTLQDTLSDTSGMEANTSAMDKNQDKGKQLASGQKALTAEQKEMVKTLKDSGSPIDRARDRWDALTATTNTTTESLEDLSDQAADTGKSVNDMGNMAAQAKPKLNLSGTVVVQTAVAATAIGSLIGAFISLQKTKKETDATVATLGGGSIQNDVRPVRSAASSARRAAAAAAARAAEEARREAVRRDYDMIAHKRHMSEITLEIELQMLEDIRKNHQLNAEEIMDWEEKIYDVKKEIRDRDAQSLDKLGDSMLDAVEARYQKMLDAEVERLDKNRQAWTEWRDESVKAIEDQIAALEELAKTEDREKQDQEELRRIAKIRQDIEFEQDEYNRMKLQQQLEQAIESREERLNRQAREDQREALRKDVEGIRERAEEELKLLDEEQKTIEEAYREQMKAAALRAEAEKLILTQSQEELLELLGEYAPEYNALGKTLGEKLVEGFEQKVGSIVDWFMGQIVNKPEKRQPDGIFCPGAVSLSGQRSCLLRLPAAPCPETKSLPHGFPFFRFVDDNNAMADLQSRVAGEWCELAKEAC